MSNFCAAGVAVVLLAGACAPSMAAEAQQAAPSASASAKPGPGPSPARLPDGKPNWTGFWVPPGGLLEVYRGPSGLEGAPAGTNAVFGRDPSMPAMKSPYKEKYEATLEALKQGPLPDKVVLCYPVGMPGMMSMIYGMEILQTPNEIAITSEWMAETRRIWMDLKEHPPFEELDPTYDGHSIGHWEGDVLVVDTVGLRPDVPFRHQIPYPHGERTQVVERFHQTRPDTLVDEMSIIDPDVFEAPWKKTYTYHYQPTLRIREYVCLDNNRNIDDEGRQKF